MNNHTMEDAVRLTLSKLLAMSHEELQREMVKRRDCEFAVLFRTAREFDDNFMRPAAPATSSSVLSAEFLQQLEQWINHRIEQQVEKSLANLLPQLLADTLVKPLSEAQLSTSTDLRTPTIRVGK